MKKYLLILLLFFCSSAFAQEDTLRLHTGIEVMPEFPGGEQAMFRYLISNTKYPPKARKKNITGKVFVNFTVEKDGRITEVKIIRSAHPLLDEEAIRVIASMPVWKPGMQDGRLVRASLNLPLSFTLK